MSEIDLAYQMALRNEETSQQKDPGTSLKHPTLRKGIITSVSPLQVDNLPASNIAGFHLEEGRVVWLLVDAGRRLVIGPSSIGRMTLNSSTFTDHLRIERGGHEVDLTVSLNGNLHIRHGGVTKLQVTPNGMLLPPSQVSDRTFGGSTSLGSGFQTLASVTLSIPSEWGSWWNEVHAHASVVPASPSSNRDFEWEFSGFGSSPAARRSIVFAGNPTAVAMMGRVGGSTASSSGNHTFNVRGRLTINDNYSVAQCFMVVTAHRIT